MPDLDDLLQPLIDRPTHGPEPLAHLRAAARRRARRRRGAAALAVVLAIALPTLLALQGGHEEQVATAGPASTAPATGTGAGKGNGSAIDAADPGLPAGFDPTTAPFVFTTDGADVYDAVKGYVASRLGTTLAVTLGPLALDGELAAIPWSTAEKVEAGAPEQPIAHGRILLRRITAPSDPGGKGKVEPTGGAWGVIASTTASVDLSGIVNDGARVTGTITSDDPNFLAADLLDPDGTPVPGSPDPGGKGDSPELFGTAGTADGAPDAANGVVLDIPIAAGTAPVLKVHLVGGTFLSVSEVAIVPGAAEETPTGATAPGRATTTTPATTQLPTATTTATPASTTPASTSLPTATTSLPPGSTTEPPATSAPTTAP